MSSSVEKEQVFLDEGNIAEQHRGPLYKHKWHGIIDFWKADKPKWPFLRLKVKRVRKKYEETQELSGDIHERLVLPLWTFGGYSVRL